MDVLGWVFVIIVALAVLTLLVLMLLWIPEFKRYTKIRSM